MKISMNANRRPWMNESGIGRPLYAWSRACSRTARAGGPAGHEQVDHALRPGREMSGAGHHRIIAARSLVRHGDRVGRRDRPGESHGRRRGGTTGPSLPVPRRSRRRNGAVSARATRVPWPRLVSKSPVMADLPSAASAAALTRESRIRRGSGAPERPSPIPVECGGGPGSAGPGVIAFLDQDAFRVLSSHHVGGRARHSRKP